MPSFSNLLVALVAAAVSTQAATYDPLASINIVAPDGSAKATFIARGATTTNFYVKDKHGQFRDIILGYDNHTHYAADDEGHPYFGPIVGRYANRITNGTFTIPISKNGAGPGTDTLHGGTIGFDRRNWTIVDQTLSSVSFNLIDPDGFMGFPGQVNTTVTYTLEPKSTWKISIGATATKQTPILLSGHHYWNLEAYQETQDLVGHMMQIPASQVVHTNGALIPDGTYMDVAQNPALDFRVAKSLGGSINATAPHGYCGTGCVGFDNCWKYDNNNGKTPTFSVWSVNSGIKLDVTTNQEGLQIYSCNGIYSATAPIPRKADQGGGPGVYYQDHSCLVIEQEGIIDAIDNPEYKIDQIYGPDRPYLWEATYAFSTLA